MKYLSLLVLLNILLLAGCDDRGSENPKMKVWAEAEYGNFVFNKSGFSEMKFYFQLDGPLSKIIERKITVDLVNDMGNFLGDGSNQYLTTDDNGYAEGRFIASDGYGSAQIQFVLYNWPSETETFVIPIYDFPTIDSLVAGTESLHPNGIDSTSITAYVSSADLDFSNVDVKVLFEASDGTITQPVTFVDASGVATTNLIAPNEQALIKVKARLYVNSASYKSINIKCENP